MQDNSYVCDRCGDGFKGPPAMMLTFYQNAEPRITKRDLCSRCVGELRNWIDEGES